VNKGDEAFTFELMGVRHSVAAGASGTVTIPLVEDQAYDFTINGPGGYGQRFAGVLDCRTRGSASGTATQTLSEPSPATVGGTASDVNLADTGGGGSTPLIAAMGLSLLVLGVTALSIVRKKKTTQD
jgi:LPXTG-motif cell wall-anchored protein